jgi:N-acetylglucosaminyldiphosphoundecaprenol N-acetyl-beta-D-mannosaminyltransferase
MSVRASADSRAGADGSPGGQTRIRLLGLPVDCVDLEGALDVLSARIDARRAPGADASVPQPTAQVVTLNAEILMRARTQLGLRALIRAADLVVADSSGIVWASRVLGAPLPERVTGVDLVQGIARRAAERGYRLFLLGAAPGVAREAAGHLERSIPGLRIAGTFAGTSLREGDEEAILRIRAADADVVLVAYGSPAQEYWIARTRERLGAAIAVGVGGTFDFLAGRVPRAPQWMQRSGLEWLYRLWREPWRWRRMLALPRFVLAVARARLSGEFDAEQISERD